MSSLLCVLAAVLALGCAGRTSDSGRTTGSDRTPDSGRVSDSGGWHAARTPKNHRAVGSSCPHDMGANSCETESNCRVDSDCGPRGYCSPSQVEAFCMCPSAALCGDSGASCSANGKPVPCECGDACGHGYFCHTRDDTCVDDSDCPDGTCNYDTVVKRWTCAWCMPVP
jgi:hypothetical protein